MLLAQIARCHSKGLIEEITHKKFQLSSSKTEFFTAVWSFDFFQTIFYSLHAFIRITAHAHTRISRGVEKKLVFSLILMKNPDLKSLWHLKSWSEWLRFLVVINMERFRFCMAVVLRIILVIFIPYIRKHFPIKIISDVFDNCLVWLWTFLTIVLYGREAMNLFAKSLTIVPYGF